MKRYLLDTNAIIYALNQGFKLPDSIIVATAISQDAILVTSDKQLINSQIVETISLEELYHRN